MQRWEYGVLYTTFRRDRFESHSQFSHCDIGVTMDLPLDAYQGNEGSLMVQLGQEGWELVAVIQDDVLHPEPEIEKDVKLRRLHYFKRPLEETLA